MSNLIRVKMLQRDVGSRNCGDPQRKYTLEHQGCLFIMDGDCRDYDWLVVYEEVPRGGGSVVDEAEQLACPKEHTILVTSEPPTIKVYPSCYTRQFAHVLTTHPPEQLAHPNHHFSEGSLFWWAKYPLEEVFSMPDYEKTHDLSTVCSAKQQTHTLHQRRYNLVKYISEHIPELDWYGRGVKPLEKKCDALSPYRYHIAMENYIAPYHWTEKISDPLLGLCLTFYAGDPRLGDILPPESFIPIPADDPEEACRIIRTAIDNHEYERRLPAIREARRLLLEKYCYFSRVASVIHEAMATEQTPPQVTPCLIKGRHRLRRNPINAISGFLETLRCRKRLSAGN